MVRIRKQTHFKFAKFDCVEVESFGPIPRSSQTFSDDEEDWLRGEVPWAKDGIEKYYEVQIGCMSRILRNQMEAFAKQSVTFSSPDVIKEGVQASVLLTLLEYAEDFFAMVEEWCKFDKSGRGNRTKWSDKMIAGIKRGITHCSRKNPNNILVTAQVLTVLDLWVDSVAKYFVVEGARSRSHVLATTNLLFNSRFKQVDSELRYEWALKCDSVQEVESQLFPPDQECEVAMVYWIGGLERYKKMKEEKAARIFRCLLRMRLYEMFMRAWARRNRSVADDVNGLEMEAEKLVAELELFEPLRTAEDYMGVLRANALRVKKEIDFRVLVEVGGPEVPMGRRGGGGGSRLLAIEGGAREELLGSPISSPELIEDSQGSPISSPEPEDWDEVSQEGSSKLVSTGNSQQIGVFMATDRFYIRVGPKIADFSPIVNVKALVPGGATSSALKFKRALFKLEDLLDPQKAAQVDQEILLAPSTSSHLYNEELLALHFSNAVQAMKLTAKVLTPGDQLIAMALPTHVNSVSRQRLKTSLSLIGFDHTLFVQVPTALAVSVAAEVPAARGRNLVVIFVDNRSVQVTLFYQQQLQSIALATDSRKHGVGANLISVSEVQPIVQMIIELMDSVLQTALVDGSAVNSGVLNVDKPLVTSSRLVTVDPGAQRIFKDLKKTIKERFASLHLVLKHRKSILDGLAKISAEGAEYNKSRLYQELCPWTLVADSGSEQFTTVVNSNQFIDQVITIEIPLGDLKSDQLTVYREGHEEDQVPLVIASNLKRSKSLVPPEEAWIQVVFDPQGLLDLRPSEAWQKFVGVHKNCMPTDNPAAREEAVEHIRAILSKSGEMPTKI